MLRFIDALCQALFCRPQTPLGRMVETAIKEGFRRGPWSRSASLSPGLLRLGLMLFGWMAIVAPFGASARRDVFRPGDLGRDGLQAGPTLDLAGADLRRGRMVFVVGLAVTRAWCEELAGNHLPAQGPDGRGPADPRSPPA